MLKKQFFWNLFNRAKIFRIQTKLKISLIKKYKFNIKKLISIKNIAQIRNFLWIWKKVGLVLEIIFWKVFFYKICFICRLSVSFSLHHEFELLAIGVVGGKLFFLLLFFLKYFINFCFCFFLYSHCITVTFVAKKIVY